MYFGMDFLINYPLISMRSLILITGLCLFFLSCSKSNLSDTGGKTDSLAATSYLDVAYGEDAQQKLDIYLPAMRDTHTPLVIVIHGGGWSAGDKTDFTPFIAELQRRMPGYAYANVNYRLATKSGNYFPTQENDIASAVKFLRDKASSYVLSRDFIIIGISAGAHLGLLQAYKHPDVLKPVGMISFYGPTDLTRLFVNSDPSIPWTLKSITNASPETNPSIFSESSPVNYVNADAPPTLLLHGDADTLIPLEQATLLHDKLDAMGVRNNLIVYPGAGHGWEGDQLTDSFNKVEAFIRSLE